MCVCVCVCVCVWEIERGFACNEGGFACNGREDMMMTMVSYIQVQEKKIMI